MKVCHSFMINSKNSRAILRLNFDACIERYEHISTINDTSPNHNALLGHTISVGKSLAKQEGIEDSGYRLVYNVNRGAGQSVFHIHLHLLGGRLMEWPPG